jgi:ComEC/Rec2-related protein
MESSILSPPRPLFDAALSAASGVGVCDFFSPPLPLCLALCSGALVYLLFQRVKVAALVFVFALAGTLHEWRHQLSPSRVLAERLEEDAAEVIELYGEVEDVPRDITHISPVSVPGKGAPAAVPVSERLPENRKRGVFYLKVIEATPSENAPPASRLLVFWRGALPTCGDRVWLRGALQRIPRPRNPGEMDVARFHMRQDVWAQVSVRNPVDACILERGGWRLKTWAARVRELLSAQLLRGIEDRPQIHELITSMVFGMQGNALGEIRPWFRDSGTLHVFAVSGLNLSMLAGFLMVMFRLSRAGPRVVALAAIPLLVLYAVVTGLGPSCVRALVVSLFLFGTEWMRRPPVALNSLGGAALLLLLWDGNALFQLSFQLSFGLVLSLYLGTGPLVRWAGKAVEPDPLLPRKLWNPAQQRQVRFWRKGVEAFASVFLCWCAGLPWSVFAFHQITPVSILANLAAVPLSFLCLALGFLALLFAPLKGVTPVLNRLNANGAQLLLDIVYRSSALPGGHTPVGVIGKTPPSLVVFDLRDGGAVLLREGKCRWLMDCGSEKQAGAIVIPALQGYGFSGLDGLFLSHGDSAHVGGVLGVFEAFSPAAILRTAYKDRSSQLRRVHEQLLKLGAPLGPVAASESLSIASSAACEVLFPPTDLHVSVADDQCLVLRWTTPEWSILYTADAGLPAERWLLEHARERLAADVWIRGSHGRELTGSDDFVNAIHPKVVVVAGSRARENSVPLEAWSQKWRLQGVVVWRQEECGAVEGWPGKTNRLRTFLSGVEFEWPSEPSKEPR